MSNPLSSFIRVPSSDFPSDILKWMKENAAPKMALRLMKCCKYFQHFPEFPFFVVKSVSNDGTDWNFIALDNQKHVYQSLQNLENENMKKLWITDSFCMSDISNMTSLIIPKIAVCDVKRLQLFEQELSYNDFLVLSASGNVRHAEFFDTFIKFENGDSVFIDSLFKTLPNVKEFFYNNGELPIFSNDFVFTFIDILALKLESFTLMMISFDYFVLFTKFMDHNPHVNYFLEFNPNSLSDNETKTVEKYVQRIIDSGVIEYPPPIIEFPGQSEVQWNNLNMLSSKYKNQKRFINYP